MQIAYRRREQEVWQACDDLWSTHGDMSFLTGDAIRERLVDLGKSRGSPNEIYKYRKTWTVSRKIENLKDNKSENNDPITRAVRMVHEELKGETDSEIKKIRDNFRATLEEKEKDIKDKDTALAKLMEEFSILKEKFLNLEEQKENLQQDLTSKKKLYSEIENKYELAIGLWEKEKAGLNKLVDEIKKVHEKELIRALAEVQLENKKLADELHQKGITYSENLMELKTKIYNLELTKKNVEEKVAEYEVRILDYEEALGLKENSLTLMKEKEKDFISQITTHKTNLTSLAKELLVKDLAIRKLNHELTKAHTKISRLRYAEKLSQNSLVKAR